MELPSALIKLNHALSKQHMWICSGLDLGDPGHDALRNFFLDADKYGQYKHRFQVFATATRSGSLYALFKPEGTENADPWPVLVLGDEGGALILAGNMLQLMRFWTLGNVVPYVDSAEGRSFNLVKEAAGNDNRAYTEWLRKEFALEPLRDIAQAEQEIIRPAMAMHQQAINPIFAAR